MNEEAIFEEFLEVSGINEEMVKKHAMVRVCRINGVNVTLANYALGVWFEGVSNSILYFPKENIPINDEDEEEA